MSRQPPAGTKIDWSNPLTRNLFYAYAAGSTVDLVSHTAGELRGGASLKGVGKRVLNTDGVDGIFDSNVDSLLLAANTDAWSAIWFGRTSAASGTLVGQRETNDSNFQLYLISDAGLTFEVRIGTIGLPLGPADAAMADGSWRMLGATSALGSNTVEGWNNGISMGAPVAITGTPYTAANVDIAVGARWQTHPTTGFPLAGDTVFALVWKDRTLSAEEMKSLVDSPYQIFKPQRILIPLTGERVFVVQDDATTIVTINLVDEVGTALSNLTSLSWAWFDESTVSTLTSPTASGTGETTDGSGELSIDITGTTLTVGQTGVLTLMDSTGHIYALYRVTL